MLTKLLNKITEKIDLSRQEAADLIDLMSSGQANPAQIAAFLAAIKTKGETTEEITGFAARMRELAVKINTNDFNCLVDTCGTGGDGLHTFNISTASAILASACGLTIAKHSNSSITSKCGSSNVLEALGIPLLNTPELVEDSLKKHSIAFIHAPYFHKSTFHINTVRKELGIRTIFNFLGPLTNPTCPAGQVIGVSSSDMLPKIAETLRNLGCKKAMVVCGIDPVIDEISICGQTKIFKLENEKIEEMIISPEDFGFKQAKIGDIAGSTPDINAEIIKDLFEGKIKDAKLDVLLLNTAAVLWAGNLAKDLKEGIKIAAQGIESGNAKEKLSKIANL